MSNDKNKTADPSYKAGTPTPPSATASTTAKPVTMSSSQEEKRAFLVAKGWQASPLGIDLWTDPQGLVPQTCTEVEKLQLKKPGGGVETIHQKKGPPIPWDYILDQAVSIQLERDKKGTDTVRDRLANLQKENEYMKRVLRDNKITVPS